VIEVDKNQHVLGFQEKPEAPKTIPKQPDDIYASMGIYLFNRDALLKELQQDAQSSLSENDFGKNVIPQMIKNDRKVYVYNFVDHKNQPKYWRDIGTRDAYYQANMDLLAEHSEFDLFDRSWPVRTYHEQYPPIKIASTFSGKGSIVDSMIAGGCVINGGVVERSILSANVKIGEMAEIKNSIILEGVTVGKNAKIQNAIIDKEVVVPDGSTIGYDLEGDRECFTLTKSGVVIVAKKSSVLKPLRKESKGQ
jgi:glucose-1-phosphate adenylyltransferase